MKYAAYENYVPSESVWLDQLPSHWQQLRVKHVIERMESGVSVNSDASPATSDEIGVLKTSCVYGDQFSPQENKRVLEDEVERVACHVKADRLIISRMNTPELVGSCGHVGQDFPNLYLPDRLWQTVFSKSRECLPRFAWYYLTSRPAKSAISSLAAGTSGSMQNIAQDAFIGIGFPLPPIDEQQTIARFLDAKTAQIDALVVQKRQLIAKLKEKRSALIARTVTRGLPPEVAKAAGLEPNPEMKDSGVDWLGEIPTHWQLPPLFRVVRSIQTGPFGTQLHQADYVDDEVPLINPIHLVDGELRADSKNTVTPETADRLSRYKLVSGDVVFARRGDIGRCGVTLPEQEGWLCGTGSMVVRLHEDYCDPGYYALVFRSSGFSSLLELNAVGTTMLNLNPSILGRMLIPVPPLTEQKSILVFLEGEILKFDNLMQYVETAIARLTEYRQALITSAVTGKIDVRNWQSELVAA